MNIKSVAARAKVSAATVSRTINSPGTVHPRTATKVLRAIKELGYYPNTQARALVSGRSHLFGLIISDIANPFFPELVKHFEEAALRKGYEVMVANTNYRSDRMRLCIRRLIERKVDGVAVMTSEIDNDLILELAKRDVALVFLDAGKIKKRISDISVDYESGIREGILHLVGLGHQRFGFISGPLTLKSAVTRRQAFLKSLRECGIPESQQLVVEGNHRYDGGVRGMQELLSAKSRPTAVLASNDLTAIGAMHAIFDLGLRVPDDISIVGFDDIELAQYTYPALTSIKLSREELGNRAFDALYRSVEGIWETGREIEIVTSLVARQSTSRVRQPIANKQTLK